MVLVVVLWVSAIFGALCLATVSAVQLAQSRLRMQRAEATGAEAVTSSIAAAKALILRDDSQVDTLSEEWARDGEALQFENQGWLVRIGIPAAEGWRPGLEDEASRLNANTATAEMLGRLPGMTPAVAGALVALREQAMHSGPGGGFGAALPGVTGPLASDAHLAAALAVSFVRVEGKLQRATTPAANAAWAWPGRSDMPRGVYQAMTYLTVHSRRRNTDSQGSARVNINTAGEAKLLAAAEGNLTQEQAEAIVLTRAEQPFSGIGDLLVRPLHRKAADGQKQEVKISSATFAAMADRLTTTDAEILWGMVNVNTAPAEVLRVLPGLDKSKAAQIVSRRASLDAPSSRTIAWLLDVISDQAFADVCPFVTVRTQQFRLHIRASVDGQKTPRFGRGAAGVSHADEWAGMAILERDANRCSTLVRLGWRVNASADDNALQ